MSTWAALLVHLAAPAFVVAWSPLKIIPGLALVFGSVKPMTTAVAFVVGSLAGLAAMTALFIAAPHALDAVDFAPRRLGVWALAAVAVGTVVLLMAVRTWMTRKRIRTQPQWLSKVTTISPLGALALGTFLTVANPKVLAMNAAAGIAIGAAAVGALGAVGALTVYTVLAGSTVLLPVVGYAIAAERVDRWMVSARERMRRHQSLATTLALAVTGLVLVAFGVRSW